MRGPALVKCPLHPILWHPDTAPCPLCAKEARIKDLEAQLDALLHRKDPTP